MANVNVTNKFLNENKRYREDVVVTLPAVLNEGGGRANALPTYVQGGDTHTASVVEADTIVQKAYVIVDEAFAALTTATITIGGVAFFTTVDVATVGLLVSATVDELITAKGDVVITLSGTGDHTVGKIRVVIAAEHPSLKNGQYAN
jgi:hypothetical protein